MGNKGCCCNSEDAAKASFNEFNSVPAPSPTHPKGRWSLSHKAGPRTPAKVSLSFETVEGAVKEVVVTHRPLGIDFLRPLGANSYKRPIPLTVQEVARASHAHDLGIRKGWKLRRIDGQDMLGESYEAVFESLFKKTSLLEYQDYAPLSLDDRSEGA